MAEKNSGAANLTPNANRTRQQLSDMGRRGGVKSGESRRQKRETRTLIREVLNLTPKTSKKTLAAIEKIGYDVEAMGGPTVEQLMHMAIANQAMAGDLASAAFLYNYGQIPDLKATLERDRMKIAREAKARVDLNVSNAEGDAVLAEVRKMMGTQP